MKDGRGKGRGKRRREMKGEWGEERKGVKDTL